MNTTSTGAVGFAPVGTFVNDLAQELGKSASTLAAYLKKHLPSSLSKRKNSNNRLANWTDEAGAERLRAHYKPTYAPQAPSELELEVQRLRDENRRLRALLTDNSNATVEELEAEVQLLLEESEADSKETKECLERAEVTLERINNKRQAYDARKQKVKEAVASAKAQIEICQAGEPARQAFLERINADTQNYWRQANDLRKQRRQ